MSKLQGVQKAGARIADECERMIQGRMEDGVFE